jgi:hypothetical protein
MREKTKLHRLRTVLIVVGSVIGTVALLLAAAYVILGEFHDNKAQDAVAPLEQRLQAVGGQKLCSSGFAGYGLLSDADTPWYRVIYRVPDWATAKKTFSEGATSIGYPLISIKRDDGSKLDESFDSHPSDGGTGLHLEIHRNTRLSAGCDGLTGSVSGQEALLIVSAPDVPR